MPFGHRVFSNVHLNMAEALHRVMLGVLLVCVSVSAWPQARSRIQLVDRIIAVVDQEVITQFELNDRMQRVTRELEQRNTPLPPKDVLEAQVLERLITERVQLQRAAETGLRVDDQLLDRTVERVAQSNNMTPERSEEHTSELQSH